MSEELLQRGLDKSPEKIGKFGFYNIGSTSIKALKENNIIRDVDYGKAIHNKKVDGIIVYQKNVIAIIENKTPKEFNTKTKQQKAINQEIKVAKKLGCKIIIATDTKKTIWVNALTGKEILNENGTVININWNPVEVTKNQKLVKLIEKINASIDRKNNQIISTEFVNPTNLAKSIWQDIWTVSGASPENCLYTFVELFIFKYLSDLEVLKSPYNFDSLISMYEQQSEGEVLNYYARNSRTQIKKLFPHNPSDNTTIINGTIFVNKKQEYVTGYSAVFKKVLERFRKYGKLENINYDFKSQLFESFLKESISKKNWGQFFTPLKVVRGIEKMATNEIREGIKICDPACGVGKFLLEPIKDKLVDFYEIKEKSITKKITIEGFDKGFDNDEQKTIILAKANMLIYFSDLIKENPNLTKEFSELFNQTFHLKTNSILGTLSDPVENKYDLILTNPPYVTSGSSNLKTEISRNKKLEHHYKANGLGLEGLFMEWIIRALKPNGKAYVVVPDGIFNRNGDTRLRKFIKEMCFIDAIISLPLNTFFSTPKKTYILVVTKKQRPERIQTFPVFSFLVSEIGESLDNYRFDKEEDDLSEAVILFNMFKGSKQAFQPNNTRCKILDISLFDDLSNWIIDEQWTKEERMELGIVEKSEVIKMDEVPNLIKKVSETLLNVKTEIESTLKKKKKEIKYKSFLISDIFDLPSIKGVTKTFINKHPGTVPVYAGKREEIPFGYIDDNLDVVKYFNNCIGWNRNGSAGYVFVHNHKFTTTDDHRPMILKKKYQELINLKYARFYIERKLLKFSWNDKAGKDKIKELSIKLPFINNQIDINIQNTIVEKIKLVDKLKSKVEEYKKYIQNLNIKIEHNFKYKQISVLDLFGKNNIIKGSSKYTNRYINDSPGNYPLYSSQTTNNGVIGYINQYDHHARCITWTTDGVYAGSVFLRNGKFSMTTHCGALVPSKTTFKNISLEYVFHYLKHNLKKYAKGAQNKRVTVSVISDVPVKIPITAKGDFDLIKQRELVEQNEQTNNIKIKINNILDRISNINVEF